MNKRKLIIRVRGLSLIIIGLLLLISKSFAQQQAVSKLQKKSPNILFVLVDDLGWTDVNCFDPLNRDYYETPNIDKLATQGMKFTEAYTNAANCSPSRAEIMSGQIYPHEPLYNVGEHPRPGSGTPLIEAYNPAVLPLEKITIAEALRKEGYKTGFIGKWDIGNPPETGPQQQGFDINIGGYNAKNPGAWKGGYYKPGNNPYIPDARQGEYLTDYLTRKAQEFIKAHHDKPFYLQLSYYAVHTPLQPKPELFKKYKNKTGKGKHDNPAYAAMIESLDQNIGKLMRTLKESGIANNTIVIFFSDNGGVGGYGYLGHHEHVTDNSPLKGGKSTYYEGGIRVPLIIRWPKVIKPGAQCSVPVISVDFYPTLLDAAGISLPDNYELDGESILPLLKDPGSTIKSRALYWHFPGYPNFVWRSGPVSVIRSGKWKLIKFYEKYYGSGEVELYNVDDDISEEHDVSSKYPEIANKLLTKLEIWLEENNAPMPAIRKKEDNTLNDNH